MNAVHEVLGDMVRTAVRVGRAATTPLLPDDYLDLVAPLHNPAALRGRIVSVLPETKDSVSLEIKPGVGWKGYKPGQYVRVGVDVDGVRLWRAYSLTSGPRKDDRIAVTVKAIKDGVVSNHLVRHARPGMIVQLDQATGDFTLPAELPRKILFVTAGSGVTPVMGMLRWLGILAGPRATPGWEEFNGVAPRPDIVVVHAAPSADDVIFGGELRQLAKAGRIALLENHDVTHGYLDEDKLIALVPDLAERETWACGPTPLLDLIEQLFTDKGIADQLHIERFRPTVVKPGEGGTVTYAKAGKDVEVDGATTLLAAGEEAGVLMRSGCRMGICMGCKVPLTAGAVRDLRDGALTVADDVPIEIQTCISAPAGACTIEA